MSYGWDEEVRADAPAARFRLGDARGSSTVADAVGGAAGSVRGGVTLAQASLVRSDADGAALFDGSTGFVTIADRAGVKVTGSGAIEAWIRPTSYRDSRGLGGCIYDGGAREPIIRFADALDGRVLARVNSVGNIVTSTVAVPLNARTHVRVVLTLSGGTVTAKIYFNGSDVTGTVTAQTVTSNALPKCIGAADGGVNNFFAGTIDELAIYNRSAPSEQRVHAHYQAAMGLPTSSARPVIVLDQVFASSARTSLRVSRPAGAKVGDVIVLALKLHSTSVTPGHADWTLPTRGRQVNTIASKQHQLAVLWHRVRADDPSSWTIAWDGSSLTTEGWARVVRGAPRSGDPIDVIDGGALTGAGSLLPYTLPVATGPGLAMRVWASFAAHGFPQQPARWWYGAGAASGAAVGSFEKLIGGDGMLPVPSPYAGSSDAWTTVDLVVKDGGLRLPQFARGLCGTSSPNDGGWPDPYTPTLAIGANRVRIDFGPGMSQRAADAEFSDAAARGLRVLPVISQYQQISTIDKAAFARYVGDFVARYGRGGAFWSGRADARLAPIFVEIFNEPWGSWFVTRVEPDHYADLYIQAVRAGRAANPRCAYLIAGVDRYFASTWQDWFGQMFTAQPTLASYIDGVTVHLYGTHPLDLTWWGNYSEWPQMESIAPDLFARGVDIGGRVKFHVTEYGFTTVSDTASPNFGVSEADQASQHLAALRVFYGRWADLLATHCVYRYRDGATDTRENRWGIARNSDGGDKPAKTALAAGTALYNGPAVRVFTTDQPVPCRLLGRASTIVRIS